MTWEYNGYVNVKILPQTYGDFFAKILKRRSFLVIVVGDPDSGKSYTTCSICSMITPDFCEKDVLDILGSVKPRLRELEEETKKGRKTPKVLNLDDFGSELDAMDYGTTAAKQTSWLFQKGRKLKVGCFLTVPDKELINKTFRERIPNFMLEVLGHNEVTGYAEIKLFRIQRNKRSGVVYYHRIYFDETSKTLQIKKKEGFIPMSRFKIPKPSKAFLEWYEPFRTRLGIIQLEDTPNEKPSEPEIDEMEYLTTQIVLSGETYLNIWRKKKKLNKELVCAMLKTSDGKKVGRKTADNLNAYLKHKQII